jgi:hypothetical protein
MPLKVYLVENGEFSQQITPTKVSKSNGKSTGTFELDAFISDYF